MFRLFTKSHNPLSNRVLTPISTALNFLDGLFHEEDMSAALSHPSPSVPLTLFFLWISKTYFGVMVFKLEYHVVIEKSLWPPAQSASGFRRGKLVSAHRTPPLSP